MAKNKAKQKQLKLVTMPLTPLDNASSAKSGSERIRPATSLNSKWVLEKLKPSIIAEFVIKGKQWYVANVLSAYSPTFHVMLIECSINRNVPAPEYLEDQEGRIVVERIRDIVQFLIERDNLKKISVGYNWSPRAWGQEEEKGGYQSVMRLHFQIWQHPSDEENEFVQWIDLDDLTIEERRLIDNSYASEFGSLFEAQFRKKQILDSPIVHGVEVSRYGLEITFTENILDLFSYSCFSKIIKPMADVLDETFRNLTESITTINCDELDKALQNAIENPTDVNVSRNLVLLRSKPFLKQRSKVVESFKTFGYPVTLLDEIFEPIRSRCIDQGDPFDQWRKGFGYAWVVTGCLNEPARLIVHPGLYVGPGGVVEAQGMILRRPILWASPGTIEKKKKILNSLRDYLKVVPMSKDANSKWREQ